MRGRTLAVLVGAIVAAGGAWYAAKPVRPSPEEIAANRAEQARRQVEALEQLGYLGGGSAGEHRSQDDGD